MLTLTERDTREVERVGGTGNDLPGGGTTISSYKSRDGIVIFVRYAITKEREWRGPHMKNYFLHRTKR